MYHAIQNFKKMKQLIIILSTALLFTCNSNEKIAKAKYFEGIVTYRLDYEPYSDRFSDKQLKELMGYKMIVHYKKGNLKKEYYSPTGELLNERYLDLKAGKYYSRKFDNDTVFWIDITVADSKSTFKRLKDTIIAKQEAIGVLSKIAVKIAPYPDSIFNVTSRNYFSKKHKLKPEWYRNFNESNFNELIKIGKGVELLVIYNNVYWTQKVEAVSIEEKIINARAIHFTLKENEILKQL